MEVRSSREEGYSIGSILNTSDTYFIDFLLECLKLDPKERIDADRALTHPWIKGNKLKKSRSIRKYNKSSVII